MSVSDAFQALRQIVLLHANVERLEANVALTNADIAGLADALTSLRDRVSRLEGVIEGVGMASAARRPKLPPK